jgi:hypothetical protein
VVLLIATTEAMAGPPYITDDPQPTEHGHYEIYAFTTGTKTLDGTGAQAGIDFNYGAAEDLQLTIVLPFGYDSPSMGPTVTGFGNVELAAKYRFLHQNDIGLDVAVFPRLFVPTTSDSALGSRHPALFIPLFAEKDWGNFSMFGGGGCTINRGSTSRDFCRIGLVLARRIDPGLQFGVEVHHQTPDEEGAKPSTSFGVGAIYGLSRHYQIMAWTGRAVQNAGETNQFSWYAALQLTY